MSADNHAHYARIGFTVMLGAVAILATLVYLGGMRGRTNEAYAETYSEKPVSGLSVGSAVNYRGVKIGEVRRISFVGGEYGVDGEDSRKIYILMAFQDGLAGVGAEDDPVGEVERCVENGLRATITASGITGLSRIELDYADAGSPRVFMPSWRTENPYIPLAPSLMDSFSDAATRVINEIDKFDFDEMGRGLKQTLGDAAGVMSNAHELVETLNSTVRSSRRRFASVMDDLSSASASLKEFAEAIEDEPSRLLRSSPRDPLPETEK